MISALFGLDVIKRWMDLMRGKDEATKDLEEPDKDENPSEGSVQ